MRQLQRALSQGIRHVSCLPIRFLLFSRRLYTSVHIRVAAQYNKQVKKAELGTD